jgi:hypothetical protein
MEKNMKSLALKAAVLAAMISLGACATIPPVSTGGGVSIPPSIGGVTVQQIQDAAVKACKFVPTAQTVAGIIASFFPGGSAANDVVSVVVNSICSAIAPTAAQAKFGPRRAGPPTVAGVRVQGYFVR